MKKETMRKGIVVLATVGLVGSFLAGCAGEAEQAAPTGEPTSTYTATATAPVQTETAAQPGEVPASAAVEDSYFDDAVFIGDSVSLKLKNYVIEKRQTTADFLGKAQFLVSGSLGSANALWEISNESVHPAYNGEKMKVEDSVAKSGAQKVYIMLGLNDVALYGVQGSVDNLQTLITKIKAKSPDASILIQSATPITKAGEKTKLTNATLVEYNKKLVELCKSKGYYYLNIASALKDSEGYLPDKYSSDNYVHFTDEACEIWVDYLRTHTPQ